MTDKISDERLEQLISYAEQSEERWVRVEVVAVLWELIALRQRQSNTSGDKHG